MAKRGTPLGNFEYYSVKPYDMIFLPVRDGEPDYPTAEDATRSVRLWDWALDKYDSDDARVFGGDGVTPYRRWLNLEAIHFLSGDDIDLPGQMPAESQIVLGLIGE